MASIPNPSLDAGIAALNQGDYSVAIAHLEGVRETELDETLVSRATQELVKAYQRNGNLEKAIALCQDLTQDSDPQIRDWSARTLPNLLAEYPESGTGDWGQGGHGGREGFYDASQSRSEVSSPNDSTGFVAFDQTPAKPKTPQRGTPSTIKQRLISSTQRLFSNSPTQNASQKSAAKKSQVNSASTAENASRLPAQYSPPPTPHPTLFTPRPRWRNSGRAKDWSPLKRLKFARLWFIEIVTAIAFFWVMRFFLRFVMGTTNNILVQLPFLKPIQLFYQDPTLGLAIVLLILLISSPWLIDQLLKRFYGLQPLSLTQLASHSPEAAQVVQSICRKRRIRVPALGVLPTDAPVALTYGNLPRTARIAVSEGLLAQLADDEIATIYAAQLGHIIHWDFALMSLGVLVIQLPYLIYWQVAQWGERLPGLIERRLRAYQKFLTPLLVGITGVVACLSYASYWFLRLPLLWFSRARLYYSDRLAVETTGNPNGMTRALLKIALGIAEEIQTSRTTSGLLESFDLLLPVGYRQAIPFGSCSPQTSFEDVLHWDCTNFYRDWLIMSASHPLLGERLAMLARYAQFWKLDTELDLPALTPPVRSNAARLSKLLKAHQAIPILQSALLHGLVLGIILRGILLLIGIISDKLGIWQLVWMYKSSPFGIWQLGQQFVSMYRTEPFLNGCILIVISLSLLLWINNYFRDIKPSTVSTEPNLGDLFNNPATLPPDSQPLQLSGKLLGRHGLLNWLGQDLILQTSTGLVRLHFSSFLGPLGNILPQSTRPSDLVEQQVTVTGWFRRGVTPWIDVETLRPQGGKLTQANYPIWITILAVVAALWGAYQIWQV